MKKGLALILVIAALLAGCATSTAGSASSQAPASITESQNDVSIETIAEDNFARIGEFDKTYAMPPSGGFSVISVKYLPEFDVKEKVLKNVIAVEIAGDYDSTKTFLSENGTAQVFDVQGKLNMNISSGVYRDQDNDKLYMLFYSDDDLSSYKYFVLGEFDKSKNDGKQRLIYNIE